MRAFPCMTLEIPRSGPQGSSLPIPDTEPHASSSGCRTEGFAGTHPSVLSTCSNSGKFWTWRSFSMSGAPRWVMPMASTIQQVPGRVSVSQVAQQCCNLLSPPLPSRNQAGTAALPCSSGHFSIPKPARGSCCVFWQGNATGGGTSAQLSVPGASQAGTVRLQPLEALGMQSFQHPSNPRRGFPGTKEILAGKDKTLFLAPALEKAFTAPGRDFFTQGLKKRVINR